MKLKLSLIIFAYLFFTPLFAEEAPKSNGEDKTTITLAELRKKADDFSSKTGTFNTKGYYAGMPAIDFLKLSKLYKITPSIYIGKNKNGNVISKTEKDDNIVIDTIFFQPEDIKKLYSFDGKTIDFCKSFLKAYTKDKPVFSNLKIGTEVEFHNYLKDLYETLKVLGANYEEILMMKFELSNMIKKHAEENGEEPFCYYLHTMKDGTIIRFYDGLCLMIQKNLKQKVTGDFN